MPYNEWGDIDPKKEAYKAYFNSMYDDLSRYEALKRIEEIEDAESWNSMNFS